jgi:hypothetical protein
MKVSEEFRKNAQRCFTLAHETRCPDAHVLWLRIGHLWFALARHAEEREIPSGANSALLHDMTRTWMALADQLSELSERLDEWRPGYDESEKQRLTVH